MALLAIEDTPTSDPQPLAGHEDASQPLAGLEDAEAYVEQHRVPKISWHTRLNNQLISGCSAPLTPLPGSASSVAGSPRPSSSAHSVAESLAAPFVRNLFPMDVCSPAGSKGSQASSSSSFNCSRCKYSWPLSEMASSFKNVCVKDAASYKSLAQRWRVNKSTKSWWNALDDGQKVQWYRNNHAVQGKRKFEETITDASIITAGHEEKELDWFMPWPVFKKEFLKEGKSEAAAEREFIALIMDCKSIP